MMNLPLAALIPVLVALPTPRTVARTTLAPCFSAMSTEPSVEPLSATTTSPATSRPLNAANALSTQHASDRASFRHGITTDISSGVAASDSREDSVTITTPISNLHSLGYRDCISQPFDLLIASESL